MIFRKANLEDIDELVKLRMEFMKEVNGEQSLDDEMKYELLTKANTDYFKENLKLNRFIAWLAIDEDKIIGTSGLIFYSRPPSFKNPDGKTAYIMNIYTLKSYRKQGIAALLLEKVIHEALSLGYHNIALNATDMGKPLYLKRGFKEVHGEMVLNI